MSVTAASTPAAPEGDRKPPAEVSPTVRQRWSVRARIMATILAVTAAGMAVAGGTTFLLQRERIIADVDTNLERTVQTLQYIADGQNPDTAGQPAEDAGGVSGSAEPSATSDAAAGPSASASASASPSTSPSPTAGSDTDAGATSTQYTSTLALLRAVVQRVIPAANESSVALIDGVPKLVPGSELPFRLDSDPAFLQRMVDETAGGQAVRGTAITDVGPLRYLAVPVAVEGDPQQGLFVAAFDMGAELDPVVDSAVTYTIIALLALVTVGVVGWFVAGRLLRPIRELRTTASTITLSDLSRRIPVAGHDDVSELTRTVNSMLDRLERSATDQRQLLDDVRHELRTPLTIVHGHLEVMDAGNPDDVAATRELALAELDRMARLVSDIGLLAQAEDRAEYRFGPVDLDALTERVASSVAVIPGHEWAVEDSAVAVLHADEDRLVQAWLQLAENAAKYAPQGTPIELGSTSDGRTATLWLRDHGPGVPDEAKDRIFTRLGRAVVGRNVDGSGLGLSIVSAIVAAHGGAVSVTDTAGGGATFSVTLPLTSGRRVSAAAGTPVASTSAASIDAREGEDQ